MGGVQVLSGDLVAQIAAGEVIERPVSVVKELVENSLDAGSSRIVVEVEAGGKRRIRVSDDGHGMERDDLLLAFERHATSKIRSLQDLQGIATLGFRGEALPSIVAVSRVQVRTATAGAEIGTMLEVVKGKLSAATETVTPRGTVFEIDSLFESLPARKKFLRSIPTEMSQITDLVNRYALAFPGVSFRLTADGRELLDAPATEEFPERIRQVFGTRFAGGMIPVQGDRGYARLQGAVSRPDHHFSVPSRQILFVNRRMVRDRSVSHAIREAYRRILPARRFPAVLLFLQVPAHAVDVNVHPAKTEVRFRDPSLIHDLVSEGIRGSLSSARPVVSFVKGVGEGATSPVAGPADRLREATESYLRSHEELPEWSIPEAHHLPEEKFRPVQGEMQGPPVTALAQYRDSFIIAADSQGLLFVDQHAAHERILYERYMAGLGDREPDRQSLLVPRTLDITATQMVALEAAQETLRALGFRLEPFGKNSVIIREVPGLVDPATLSRLLGDLLEEVGRQFGRMEPGRLQEQLMVTTACHAAIKIHQPLGKERMANLLSELFQTSHPMTCPHGRPALLRFPHGELMARFGRR